MLRLPRPCRRRQPLGSLRVRLGCPCCTASRRPLVERLVLGGLALGWSLPPEHVRTMQAPHEGRVAASQWRLSPLASVVWEKEGALHRWRI